MSHFTVLVIGEDVDGQLAPYDENEGVDPYKQYRDTDELERLEGILSDPNEHDGTPKYSIEDGTLIAADVPMSPERLKEIASAYNRRYAEYESERGEVVALEDPPDLSAADPGDIDYERVWVDEAGVFGLTRYNPKAKWDWYQVGGRWRGFFKVKERENGQQKWHEIHEAALENGLDEASAVEEADRVSAVAVIEPTVGSPGVPESLSDEEYDTKGRADVLTKGDVDVDGMRYEAGEKAGEMWDQVHAVIDGFPAARSWDDLVAEAMEKAGGKRNVDYAEIRIAYHEQPAVKALRESDVFKDWFMPPGAEDFQVSRDEYVERSRLAALSPYAYVIDGDWHGKGNMGWFGMSDDTKNDQLRFDREFNELFDRLPDDTLLTLVDCHI